MWFWYFRKKRKKFQKVPRVSSKEFPFETYQFCFFNHTRTAHFAQIGEATEVDRPPKTSCQPLFFANRKSKLGGENSFKKVVLGRRKVPFWLWNEVVWCVLLGGGGMLNCFISNRETLFFDAFLPVLFFESFFCIKTHWGFPSFFWSRREFEKWWNVVWGIFYGRNSWYGDVRMFWLPCIQN